MNPAAGGGAPAPCAPDVPALLVNPRSFRASRWNLARRVARRARAQGLEVFEASAPSEVHAVLDVLRVRGTRTLWLLAGDGTVQAIAEYLAAHPDAGWSPTLLPLAGGRANIVPRECGAYPALPAFRRALRALAQQRPLHEKQMITLRVSQPGQPVRHGFLLAGGVIHEGVRLCSEHRARGTGWLHRSWIADPYTLLKLAVQVWTGRSPLPPYAELALRMADGSGMRAPMRVLLATTLGLGKALYNPFAARGRGPLRVTAVAATAAHFWRHLPALLGGRFNDAMNQQQGFFSSRSDWAEVLGVSGYSLDGESFPADPSLPLRLEAGVTLRVLQP